MWILHDDVIEKKSYSKNNKNNSDKYLNDSQTVTIRECLKKIINDNTEIISIKRILINSETNRLTCNYGN